MVKSQLVPLALSALLLASPCAFAEEGTAVAGAAPAAAEPVAPPAPAPTAAAGIVAVPPAAVSVPAKPAEPAPVLGGSEKATPAGGGMDQPGAMQPGAEQGAMAKGGVMDKCGGMMKGEGADKCPRMHGMDKGMGAQLSGAEAEGGMIPEACRHKCRTMHTMGGMQGDEGEHCGMGMRHGAHEMMARQQALMKRLDILDARLARIELMLEHLMQR